MGTYDDATADHVANSILSMGTKVDLSMDEVIKLSNLVSSSESLRLRTAIYQILAQEASENNEQLQILTRNSLVRDLNSRDLPRAYLARVHLNNYADSEVYRPETIFDYLKIFRQGNLCSFFNHSDSTIRFAASVVILNRFLAECSNSGEPDDELHKQYLAALAYLKKLGTFINQPSPLLSRFLRWYAHTCEFPEALCFASKVIEIIPTNLEICSAQALMVLLSLCKSVSNEKAALQSLVSDFGFESFEELVKVFLSGLESLIDVDAKACIKCSLVFLDVFSEFSKLIVGKSLIWCLDEDVDLAQHSTVFIYRIYCRFSTEEKYSVLLRLLQDVIIYSKHEKLVHFAAQTLQQIIKSKQALDACSLLLCRPDQHCFNQAILILQDKVLHLSEFDCQNLIHKAKTLNIAQKFQLLLCLKKKLPQPILEAKVESFLSKFNADCNAEYDKAMAYVKTDASQTDMNMASINVEASKCAAARSFYQSILQNDGAEYTDYLRSISSPKYIDIDSLVDTKDTLLIRSKSLANRERLRFNKADIDNVEQSVATKLCPDAIDKESRMDSRCQVDLCNKWIYGLNRCKYNKLLLSRPVSVSAVKYQDRIQRFVAEAQRSGGIPNLLFFGAPGVGKTSMALALARDLYGSKVSSFKLELNASDERGIDVIRNKVKMWSQMVCSSDSESKVSHKLIILDEADMMTEDAQHALRRIMEVYHKTTRFILICNYLNKLIAPLVSRCVSCRFNSVSPQDIDGYIRSVCEMKAMNLKEDAIDTIVRVSSGDVRRTLNVLQNCKMVYDESPIGAREILQLTAYPEQGVCKELFTSLFGTYEEMLAAHRKIVKSAYAIDDIIIDLMKRVLATDRLSDVVKAKIFVETLPVVNQAFQNSITEINLLHIMQIINKKAQPV